MSDGRQFYFYSGNDRIELTPAEDVMAIDLECAARLPEDQRAVLDAVEGKIARGIKVLDADRISATVRAALESVHALQPVFRSHGATLVVLPEVRVEESSQSRQAALREWLASNQARAHVVSEEGEQLVLRPASGSGADALDIANELAEEVHPEMAQARFLRLTSKRF
jgi:hypothetical protein